MTPIAQHNIQENRPFRLVKFFAITSFIVLIIVCIPFSMYISQKAKDILLRSHEDSALLIGKNLNHQVLQYFVLPLVSRYGGIRLREKDQRELMDKVVGNTIHGFNVDLVNIHAPGQGLISYSTDPSLIGSKSKKSKGYEMAFKGESYSGLLSKEDGLFDLGVYFMGGTHKLQAFIPFNAVIVNNYTNEQIEQLLGVWELIIDVSEQNKSIVRFQYLIFGLSILIVILIFIALLLIVHRAEKLIDQRINEQRELEGQLHLAERLAALGEMVASVSHEIKNPLGIIRSTSELLGNRQEADEAQKKLSSIITEEATRLNLIVTEFLDFAKPQALNVQECSIVEIIDRNLSFLKPELENNNITVEYNLEGDIPVLNVDKELLYRAFLNIFLNSMNAMNGEGEINISGRKIENFYQLEISDTGDGIPQDLLKKIFDPFFTTKDKGTGLGLAIVRKIIVEGHKGSINIESKEGEGAKIIIQLPISN